MIKCNPIVSVVIPVYNSQDYIKECLGSVLAQTYKRIEIIIVDDGSTDQTGIIINDLINKNKHISFIFVSQNNSGPSAARNKGIGYAQGDYIAFLDSDDQWYPSKLEKILAEFEKDNELDIISSLYSIGENTVCKEIPGSLEYISLRKLLFKNALLTSGVVCRSNVFQNNKFNENQKYSEDYRLWLEMAASGFKCAVLNECLLKMNGKPIFGASGLSSKMWKMEKGELDNFLHLFNEKKISLIEYLLASAFSFLKYVRRSMIVIIRNNNKK